MASIREYTERDTQGIMRPTNFKLPSPRQFATKLEERAWLKFRLAQAFRIFAVYGFTEGAAGHITVRDPIKIDCFWVNPLGKHFAMMQPSDLLLVDGGGNIEVAESGPHHLVNKAAFMVHSAIHRDRPDAICAAHTHSVYGKTYSAFGRPLDMISQDTCAFYNDHAVYKQFNGVVLAEEEGSRISTALGNKKAIILQNHGLLVATETIEAAVFFFVAFERACQSQLLADAASRGSGHSALVVPDADAQATYDAIGTRLSGWFQGQLDFALLEEREGVAFETSGERASRAQRLNAKL